MDGSFDSESLESSSSDDDSFDYGHDEDGKEKPTLAPIRFEMDGNGHIFFIEYLDH